MNTAVLNSKVPDSFHERCDGISLHKASHNLWQILCYLHNKDTIPGTSNI